MSSIPRDGSMPSIQKWICILSPSVPMASLMEPKREPGLPHPHPTASPRLEKSSSRSGKGDLRFDKRSGFQQGYLITTKYPFKRDLTARWAVYRPGLKKGIRCKKLH
jgi:hypothetical protein